MTTQLGMLFGLLVYLSAVASCSGIDEEMGKRATAISGYDQDAKEELSSGDLCTERQCGPMPGTPSYMCEDGKTMAGPGACERQEDGECGWTVVECPKPLAACTEAECGPRLGMANYMCQDGKTIAGPGACERQEGGTCGWTVVECPKPAEACTEAGCCNYNGQTYQSGDTFKSADGCNNCSCSNGEVICSLRACMSK